MSRRLATVTGFLLICCIVLTILVAWIGAALGYDVGNVLSAEGLRWLFVHAVDDTHHAIPLILLSLMALGTLPESGLLADLQNLTYRQERRTTVITILALLLLVILMFMGALMPFSPLLGSTGHLWPSPFMKGFYPVGCFGVILLSVLHAYRSGRMKQLPHLFRFLSHALARHLFWVPVGLLGLFFYNLLCFIR